MLLFSIFIDGIEDVAVAEEDEVYEDAGEGVLVFDFGDLREFYDQGCF